MSRPSVNAAERVRLYITRRLEELGMTKRAFGKAFSHGDAWANAVLKGKIKIALTDLDDLARVLQTTTADLVRQYDEDVWALRPTEMRAVRAIRALPETVRNTLVMLLDYLVGVTPDEAEVLTKLRRLESPERQRVEHWIDVTLQAQDVARAVGDQPGHPPGDEPLSPPVRHTRSGPRR